MSKITFNHEEKYMYLSSNLFIIPLSIGYVKDYKLLNLSNLLSLIITTSFWSTGKNDIYRKIDLIFQPINASLFLIYGNLYTKNYVYLYLGNLFFINGLYFYRRSHIEYKKFNRLWYINHLIFHSSMIIAQSLTYLV